MRRAVFELKHAYLGKRILCHSLKLCTAQARVEGPKGDILSDGWHEELIIRILENDAYTLSNVPKALFILGVDDCPAD
jgi:hypothetical protein